MELPETLAEILPELRGRLSHAKDLSGLTWLRVGGPADLFFQPADVTDLQAFLQALPAVNAVSDRLCSLQLNFWLGFWNFCMF